MNSTVPVTVTISNVSYNTTESTPTVDYWVEFSPNLSNWVQIVVSLSNTIMFDRPGADNF
jgi:hypothetical protein